MPWPISTCGMISVTSPCPSILMKAFGAKVAASAAARIARSGTEKPNRKAAAADIWNAVQTLSAKVAKQAAHAGTAKGKRKKDAPKGKRRHTARAVANDTADIAREGSKKSEVIDLMRRSQGTTLAEIMELTGWQAHTVRGFVSGTLIKKLGLKVESFRSNEKERTYRVV